MREQWDALTGKKGGQKLLKKRARKGIPDTVRGEMWQVSSHGVVVVDSFHFNN